MIPRRTATAGGPLGFDDWLQDLEQAKQQAHAHDKDIFITFNGSDWCGWCIRLMYEVFFQQDFRDRIEQDFVLVQIDSPRNAEARGKVQNPARNNSIIERFGVRGYPTIVLADSGRLHQTITAIDPPHGYTYRLDDIQGTLRPFVRSVDGAWTVTPEGDGSRIGWSWTLHPKAHSVASPARLTMTVLGRMWKGYADRALAELELILTKS